MIASWKTGFCDNLFARLFVSFQQPLPGGSNSSHVSPLNAFKYVGSIRQLQGSWLFYEDCNKTFLGALEVSTLVCLGHLSGLWPLCRLCDFSRCSFLAGCCKQGAFSLHPPAFLSSGSGHFLLCMFFYSWAKFRAFFFLCRNQFFSVFFWRNPFYLCSSVSLSLSSHVAFVFYMKLSPLEA